MDTADTADLTNLEQMLDHIREAAEGQKEVSVDDLLEAVGRRSFGPLLLLTGLVILAPLVGDIPGVPTLASLIVVLISSQLLLGRQRFWFPRWLLQRQLAASKVSKGAGWLARPARFIDRIIKPRLTQFVDGVWIHVIAVISLTTALITPVMEFVPFSANVAGAVQTTFGLALIARDGTMALVAMVLAAGAAASAAFVFF
jgi:hypothetical protein